MILPKKIFQKYCTTGIAVNHIKYVFSMNNNATKITGPVAGCMRWGLWGARFDTAQYRTMIDHCLEMGITTFDHADIYGDYTTEAEFGETLRGNNSLRGQMQLITKCGIQMLSANRPHHTIKSYNTSYEHIINSVTNSLRNFNTDYIDVLLIHRPDHLLNPAEVAKAVEDLKQEGKMLAFGVSNFLPHQLSVLHAHTPVAYNQLEVSVLKLDAFGSGQLEQCMEKNIVPMAWSPIAGGQLSAAKIEATADATLKERLQSIMHTAAALAEKYGCTTDQVFYAWNLRHPAGIINVTGSSRPERIKDALKAELIQLSREDWYKLYTASTGVRVP
jgi:predicted oxidoreductase